MLSGSLDECGLERVKRRYSRGGCNSKEQGSYSSKRQGVTGGVARKSEGGCISDERK